MDSWERGVADGVDLAYIGAQYDFDANSKWLDDDSPGNGASFGNMESTVVVGNTKDYPALHGKAIKSAGFSFDSASDEAISSGFIDLENYKIMDIIYGEQKATPWPKDNGKDARFRVFPKSFMTSVKDFTKGGGHVLLSGAYVGTDILGDTTKMNFAKNVLKYRWRTDHASKGGAVYSINTMLFGNNNKYDFETGFSPRIYGTENPDGIEPAKGSSALTVLRYQENNISAGVAYKGEDYKTFIMGFPFECIQSEFERNALMKRILAFFENDIDIYQELYKDGRKKSSNNK